jgi:hypothetical protein
MRTSPLLRFLVLFLAEDMKQVGTRQIFQIFMLDFGLARQYTNANGEVTVLIIVLRVTMSRRTLRQGQSH